MKTVSAFGVRRSALPDGGTTRHGLIADDLSSEQTETTAEHTETAALSPTNTERRTPNAERCRPGSGHLAIAHVADQSAVVQATASQPLKLITAKSRGPMAWVYATSYGGGLLSKDELSLTVEVGAKSQLLLATQASTKIYRSDDGRTARQAFDVRVAADGVLLNLPEPITPFAGSRFAQTQRIALDSTAGLCWIDGLTAGRTARDERWNCAAYSSRIELIIDQKRRWLDHLQLGPGIRSLAQRLHPWGALTTVLIGGPPLRELADQIQTTIAAQPVTRGESTLFSVSPIANWGIVLRGAAVAQELLDTKLRQFLAPLALIAGDDPWQRRP